MIINNWFKDGIMKNNNKWTSSAEREIIINDEETDLNEKLFITRTYSLNNSDTYGSPNNTTTTMNSNNICQTMNSSGSSSCDNSTQQHLTPKQFLEKYSLPRVIKIIPQEPIADSCGNFDPITLLSGQLLMYKHYNSGKVEARSFPNDRKDYSSLFVIPETYKGWFSVVTERGQIKARVYSSIQRLVSAQVTVFLTVSQDLPAYIQTNSGKDEINTQYTKTSVKSGQVLKLLAVYQDLNSNQSTKSKRLSWPLIGSKQHTSRYAQCLSSSNQVLFINFNTPGQFYAVSMTHNSTEENVTKVYQIQKLLRTFPLPVRVTIIGSNKNHGSMLLENYHKEHVVLSCVLDGADVTTNDITSEKFRLLEIDVNSKFYVVKPGGRDIDERRLFYSPLVQRALKFCNDNSEQWISQLKVIHHIYPQNSNQILPNQQQNVSIEKSKKVRKASICDKITVKSASFRYSTSYGNEIARPVIRKQDLEKPNKPKVYDFNYKQTHEFLSLSSNVTRDSNSSHENSLPLRNTGMPDIAQDRYNRSNTRSNQDSNPRSNQRPFGLPFANGSAASTGDRTPFRYISHRKENTHDSITSTESTNTRASPSKIYLPNNSSQEVKNIHKVFSPPGKESTNVHVHEAKRPVTKLSFNQNKGQEELKKVVSGNGPAAVPISIQNSLKTNEPSKDEISPVERLDRLTQSCNLLSFLNKQTNSYQNASAAEQSKNKYNGRVSNMEIDDTSESESDEDEKDRTESITQVQESPARKTEDVYKPDEPKENNSRGENISLQSLQVNGTSSTKQFDGGKHFYRVRSNESQPSSINGYRQTSSPVHKVKTPEKNAFSYLHRQETPERSTENKPFSNHSNVYRSNSSINSPGESSFSKNQSFISNQTVSSYVSSNSSQHSNQNVRNHVTKSPSSASTHSNDASVYSYNSSNNQSKYTSNVTRKPIAKPAVAPPIKTHNKTPVPMPRLNVSYAKVHDAIDDHNNNTSASSENIYAEISDR